MRASRPTTDKRYRCSRFTVYCLLFTILLSACSPTRPVVKIALVAPFEGRYRNVGYEVLYAVRLAVREANANGGLAGYSVELLALDDSGEAAEQARKVLTDPQVVGVIGHWLGAATATAAPIYDAEGLALLATGFVDDLPASAFRLGFAETPCPRSTCIAPEALEILRQGEFVETPTVILPAPLPADSSDPRFAERYRAIANGVAPSFNAVLAYDAAQVLFAAIVRGIHAEGAPTRANVRAALAETNYSGLSGPISFDAAGHWREVREWMYQWQAGELIAP